jgi:hypothetical protein
VAEFVTDVFFVQMAEVDTEARDRPVRWRTQLLYGYEDRALAEHVLAAIERLFKPRVSRREHEFVQRWMREDEAQMTFLGRLQRRVGGIRLRLYLYFVDQPQPVQRVFRVVSSTELRSEGGDALRQAEQAASLGTWRPTDERDEGDDDA